jgi:hypothetical protein
VGGSVPAEPYLYAYYDLESKTFRYILEESLLVGKQLDARLKFYQAGTTVHWSPLARARSVRRLVGRSPLVPRRADRRPAWPGAAPGDAALVT